MPPLRPGTARTRHQLVNGHIKLFVFARSQKCEFLETPTSYLVHWEDPEGWDREGGWRGDQDLHIPIHG